MTLVLVRPDGTLLGALRPFPVPTPRWPDAASVVDGARETHGVAVTVLRLLDADGVDAAGGSVTYLAETEDPVTTAAWHGTLDAQPLRHPWAVPGGPARDLAWADGAVRASGRGAIERAEQVRTWNLSSLWRLRAGGREIWLKAVPPFFAHEGPLLERLRGGPVPVVIAQAGGRTLLEDIPGENLYDAPLDQLRSMVTLLVGIQRSWIGRTEELIAVGLPDWRAATLADAIAELVDRVGPELNGGATDVLAAFVRDLAARMASVAAAGLPDTLVHGDFAPGNVRGSGSSLVLLDWGDAGVGHPLLDMAAFLDRVPDDSVATVREHWYAEWRAAVAGSQPEVAAALLAPVAAARQALIYQRFLDAIEPAEHVYHRSDPARWLYRTAEILRSE
ncbi:MAG: aminoglycoside phosphotransferase family protein [Chloroflexota bacterium]|nr:aminoglycoside phosphotransferase family protein [Chloroflexota bacterium]